MDVSRAAMVTIIESRIARRDECMDRYVPHRSRTERQRVTNPDLCDNFSSPCLRLLVEIVNIAVGKLATMIPLFLTITRFYGKRLDLYANKLPNYVDKSQSDPLEVKHMKRVPQQEESFNDCGLYTCLFAEYINNGVFDMRSVDIDAKVPSSKILFKLKLCLAFQFAYSYIQCTDASWPASSHDADKGNQDQHLAPR
uniref:Ubiquitin-like protease family profile domain-containing protein n=1 Tax=Solanum tuberosum TaxID=4113 RepID=M1DFT8_SOLTU